MGTTAMDIFRRLPRNNCRECGLPTCLAFAAAAVKGEIELSACPDLPDDLAVSVSDTTVERQRDEVQLQRERVAELQAQLAGVDLAAAAARIGATMRGDRLAIHCLGRIFELDAQGSLHSECHINPWVHGPIIDHVLNGSGAQPTGQWLPYAELANTRDWVRFFSHRCEERFTQLADQDPRLFFNVLSLFDAPLAGGARTTVEEASHVMASADRAIVLHPLPRVPILWCYWRAEEGFETRVAVRFDKTASANVGGGSLYQLCQGLVEMLRRIMDRHGVAASR